MNTSNSHWECAEANGKEREIKCYDSYKGNGEIRANFLIRCLKDEWNDKKKTKRNYWNYWKQIEYTSDIPFQPNGEFFARTHAQAQLF